MSKREHDADGDVEGPGSKMKKGEDTDDGGGSARAGRVRKKSAKVLEMEEFEQAEKVSHVNKKGKTPKSGHKASAQSEEVDTPAKLAVPSKIFKTQGESTPPAAKLVTPEVKPKLEPQKSIPAELMPRTPQSGGSLAGVSPTKVLSSQAFLSPPVKEEPDAELNKTPVLPTSTVPPQVKKEDQKSVIKYLLSSPAAGSTPSVNTKIISPSDTKNLTTSVKKSAKKIKTEGSPAVKPKQKEKKAKKGNVPSELIPVNAKTADTPSLKMKIFSGSNPMTAQVALQPSNETPKSASATKTKKVTKKMKEQQNSAQTEIKSGILGLPAEVKSPPTKKSATKKISKQKEKLMQDAITAAQQMPNLAALVASQPHHQPDADMITPPQKVPKKKAKSSSPASASEVPTDDTDDAQAEDETGESTLVIAETEKKKKKAGGRKKAVKETDPLASPKGDKKIPKRAPTAYMLFCNTHRPAIVADNPGIEFAGISRKLGELWQGLSNKQKLQWRRKAQRRKKKSNLISTGKISKDITGLTTPVSVSATISQISSNQKLANLIQKNQAAVHDDIPQSPSKNLSIEPIDVAAHLKLLGESLSIIGMRLQEHKGMIAVQGSLSVLLDSLICACGPLLCLTQQVPGMDGCSPSVHAQTLDSVAYVMPGL